mmetsp:Transcript_9583/g.24377  ORF Transcript_9583/g.24377 Transcript_9583/m.24377 type:complete len:519 (-) Transcript_9583:807-2363(-)
MMVIELQKWKTLGHFPRSSEGVTRLVRSSDEVIFISHRWWQPAAGHPDDTYGSKYGLICRGVDQLLRRHSGINPSNAVLWADFASIEQDNRELQQAGIASLVVYAARSSFVLTPVQPEPTAARAFVTAQGPGDLVNYGDRAWCRLETYVFLCLHEVMRRDLLYYAYGTAYKYADSANTNPTVCNQRANISSTQNPSLSTKAMACILGQGGGPREILKLLVPSAGKNGGESKVGKEGAHFSRDELPSSGEVTSELDRRIIRRIENDVRTTYVNYAILSMKAKFDAAAEARAQKGLRISSSGHSTLRFLPELRSTFGNVTTSGTSTLNESQSFRERGLLQMTFDLNGKQVRSEDVDFLKSALWSGTVKHNVNVLDLSDNLIGASGVATLFKHVLPHLSSLIELNLSNNPKLGLEGIKALVKSFHDESTSELKLRTLRLSHCLLGDKSAAHLANWLQTSTSLRSLKLLDVGFNDMQDDGVWLLAQASMTRGGLKLKVEGNNISAKVCSCRGVGRPGGQDRE